MTTTRWMGAGTAIGNTFYVAGGISTDTTFVSDILEAYDPSINTWTTKAPMPTSRDGFATGVIGGIIYAAGGAHTQTVSVTEAYTP